MVNNLRFFQIVQGLIITLAWTSLSSAENIKDAWQKALDHDYRIKSAKESTAAAEENIAAAKSLRMPSLKGEAAYSKIDETPEAEISLPRFPVMDAPLLKDDTVFASNISVSVPIFTSGRISNAIDSAKSAGEAARADESKTIQDIKLQVADAYTSVLRARNAVKVSKSNVETLSAHARDVKNFFDKGLVAKNDVLAVNVALSDARQLALQTENRLDIACSAYNRMLGRPLAQEVIIDDIQPPSSKDTVPEKNYEALLLKAKENRPEIKALSDQANAYEYHAKSIRASAMPQILATGSFNHFDKTPLEEENIWVAGLGLKWDAFDGGVTIHQARAEERKKIATEHRKKDAESMVELQVRQAWLEIRETTKRTEVTRNALSQAEENLKVAKNRYFQEVGSNTEVLDAETLRIKSLTNHNNAVYDSVMADMRLRRAVGDI